MTQLYPEIYSIYHHHQAWTVGLPVRITEKVHGEHANFSVLKLDDEWAFVNDYAPMDESMMKMLNIICDERQAVTVYGEIVGTTDLDYGMTEPTLMVFDIMVDGLFIPWDLVRAHCESCQIRTVPLLYEGGFTWEMVEAMTIGGSTVANPSTYKSRFKDREGVIITPTVDVYSEILRGRLISKSINPHFETRKNVTHTY
jgi:hypothetical protein